jgi:signal transduction histidine kinase
VRIRTTVLATVVVAAALLVGAGTVVLLQRNSMIASVDRTAQTHAADVATLAEHGTLPASLAIGKQEDSFVQVVDGRGHVVAASDNVRGEPAIGRVSRATSSISTLHSPALDGQFRVATRRTTSPNGPVVVQVGESLSPVQDATRTLITLLGVGLPLLLVVVAGTAWLVTGRALTPVERIRAEVAAISEDQLHRRVPEPATGDEISRLAHTMNAMLVRLDDAYARQSRFVSDASHELKSPIAALRASLEVDLAHPEHADWAQTQREALTEITALQRLVEDLLTVARLPAGTGLNHRESVDLDDLVLREADRLRTRDRIQLDLSGVSGGQVEGDPSQLARAVRNLLDNAERHANSTVTVSVQEHDPIVEVEVADDGPGIPVPDHQRVFERFARLDDARTPHTAGAGLGLAITQEIIEHHGGTVRVEDNRPGARFIIRLPAAQFGT